MPVKIGKVYLVGAGPGDPALITMKAVSCLQKADVVVYDQLVAGQILNYSRAEAEKVFVGKTVKMHFAEQDDINSLLVRKAKQGSIVVRLKGGDPFVFGRGGEEADFLQKNGVPFEIVPGITSAVAVPAYAGIPVTHRGISSSVAIVTGHEDPSKKGSSINWNGLATGADTLIFLMGMQNLPQIAKRLIECGRKPQTPVAVIKDGTLPVQVMTIGTLQNIAARVKKEGITAPAVIVVGGVVKLRERLSWYEKQPLFGKRVLITRAGPQSASFESLLYEHGAMPVLFPTIEIKPIIRNKKLEEAISRIKTYDWIIFTSVNGVEIFFQRLHKIGLDSRALAHAKIGVIGPATYKAMDSHGITPDFVPKIYTGHGLLAGLKGKKITGRKILLPRADIADDEITKGLVRLKAAVDEVALYRTVRPGYDRTELQDMLFRGKVDIVTFTSSSTVTNLVAGLSRKEISSIRSKIACIGPKTAQTALEAGLTVDVIAKKQTMEGLLEAMEEYFREEI
ncbi:MAG: uroporphyrinogen-III C-methyltransferase [Chloroflexi bacterium]|nr:uroporphyrinogen-III C-methyltransferase [Chloroflexota bacterium]